MQDPQGEIFSAEKRFQTMQLERKGKTLIMRMANPGEPLQMVGKHDLNDLRIQCWPEYIYAPMIPIHW